MPLFPNLPRTTAELVDPVKNSNLRTLLATNLAISLATIPTMESQSTVTDSNFEQVEQVLLEPVPPQREITPAEALVKLPVTVEHDKDQV